jgi:hypothetical protein
MVLDSLSGRTPLYRLKDFFQGKDTELLLGTEIDPECGVSARVQGKVLPLPSFPNNIHQFLCGNICFN